MNAREILAALGRPVHRLVSDSRKLTSGDVFAAYPGSHADGRRYIPDALARGAAAVLWDSHDFQWQPEWLVPQVGVKHLKHRLGELAAEVWGHPGRQLLVIGVTGTNGKTSSTQWIAQALASLGVPAAIVGTLGHGKPGALTPGLNTTPDAAQLQEILAALLHDDARAVAMEVSSHGLEQERVSGIPFRVALLTNLTRDHLDYHGDMTAYGAAKARLFAWPGLAKAVLNVDDAFGKELLAQREQRREPSLSYGFRAGDLRGEALEQRSDGLVFTVRFGGALAQVRSPQVGSFNAYNLLGVLGVLLALGHPLASAVEALRACSVVPGRMQRLGGNGRPLVVVDYAHTPDALANVLGALRPNVVSGGQLICVFGCGGDRDPGKRPQMGAIASRLADRVIVTSDNPRGEDPEEIIQQILNGVPQAEQRKVLSESSRAEAIDAALRSAKADDVILVAGKGHEPYQEIRGRRLPFSDVGEAQAALDSWERG